MYAVFDVAGCDYVTSSLGQLLVPTHNPREEHVTLVAGDCVDKWVIGDEGERWRWVDTGRQHFNLYWWQQQLRFPPRWSGTSRSLAEYD